MNLNSPKRKLFAKFEILLLCLALAALLSIYYLNGRRSPGVTAVIAENGRHIMTVDLLKNKDGLISLRDDYGIPVDFELKDGKIRFINVLCPDHICENTGFIGAEGQVAVCMPNKTSVTINTNHQLNSR